VGSIFPSYFFASENNEDYNDVIATSSRGAEEDPTNDHAIIPMSRSKKRSYYPSVGICAKSKDAARYFDEWIDYHLGIGFDAIYVYDNSDDNNLRFWDKGHQKNKSRNIHITFIPGKIGQKECYKDCVNKFGKNHEFMAVFDDDEFLVLKKHSTVSELVKDHLPSGSLLINWRVFGTSNQQHYSPLPVTKRFTLRDETSVLGKSIFRVKDFVRFKNPHSCVLDNNTEQRDTNGGRSFSPNGSQNKDKPDDVAVFHHYKYKSQEEWEHKTCVRLNNNGKNDKECGMESLPGTIYDASAWETLKRNAPHYSEIS